MRYASDLSKSWPKTTLLTYAVRYTSSLYNDNFIALLKTGKLNFISHRIEFLFEHTSWRERFLLSMYKMNENKLYAIELR